METRDLIVLASIVLVGWLLWALLASLARGAKRLSRRTPQLPPATPVASNQTFHLDGNDTFAVEVAGESHYQDALAKIVGGKTEDGVAHECIALLRRDPNNPHDPNAIAVTIDGHMVGHVARATAARMAPMLDARNIEQATANALITGGWKTLHSEGSFGVSLDVA